MMTDTGDPPLTAEQQAIVEKLRSPWRRMNTLYWIEDESGRKIKFRCTRVQMLFLTTLHWLTVVLKARQVRISTACAIYALDFALFRSNKTVGIIDKTDLDAQKKLARIRFAYEHLDDPDGGPDGQMIGAFLKKAVRLKRGGDNKHELQFTNDSKIWAGTSLRGGTVQLLWITEFGYIASRDPTRAAEIAAGALNTVHLGNLVIVESTHEGGRYGLNYKLVKLAEKSPPKPNAMQWKLMFFGWYQNPEYTLPISGPLSITVREREYFDNLQKTAGVRLTDGQKNWYIHKSRTPGIDMERQFPGTAEEALRAQVEGAIYGEQMARLRALGRISDFPPNPHAPLLTSWDIGVSDYTCVWLIQFAGRDGLALDYYSANGKTPAQHAAQIVKWEAHYKRPIARHFLPHDADKREASLKTVRDLLRECGIANVSVVPRTADVWASINWMRALLENFWFHATACDREFEDERGDLIPGGLATIEGYKKKIEAEGGRIVELPVHDEASHGADALRTISDAFHLGMVKDFISSSTGFANDPLFGRPKNIQVVMGRRGLRR